MSGTSERFEWSETSVDDGIKQTYIVEDVGYEPSTELEGFARVSAARRRSEISNKGRAMVGRGMRAFMEAHQLIEVPKPLPDVQAEDTFGGWGPVDGKPVRGNHVGWQGVSG